MIGKMNPAKKKLFLVAVGFFVIAAIAFFLVFNPFSKLEERAKYLPAYNAQYYSSWGSYGGGGHIYSLFEVRNENVVRAEESYSGEGVNGTRDCNYSLSETGLFICNCSVEQYAPEDGNAANWVKVRTLDSNSCQGDKGVSLKTWSRASDLINKIKRIGNDQNMVRGPLVRTPDDRSCQKFGPCFDTSYRCSPQYYFCLDSNNNLVNFGTYTTSGRSGDESHWKVEGTPSFYFFQTYPRPV